MRPVNENKAPDRIRMAERTGQATGLRVEEVVPNGAAARSGLRNGDLMLADANGSQLPIMVLRQGALVDLIAAPVEVATEDRPGRRA